MDPDRRARRHGRRAAARRDHGGRLPARGRVPHEPDRAAHRDRLSRSRGDRAGRGAGHHRARLRRAAAGLGRPARQCRRDLSRAGPPRRAPGHGDRPDLGARPAERLSAGRLDARAMAGDAGARSGRGRARRQGSRWRCRCARCSTSIARACRRSTTATTSGSSPRRWASRTRSPFRASCRPTSARCSAAARGRSAGPRCRAIRTTSGRPTPRSRSWSPDPHLHHWLDMAAERIAFQGLPARICWLGLGDRARVGLAFNDDGGERRAQGAGGDRPRPPGFRLGREPQPRDRGDARRLGCDRRLAAAERAAQHRLGRDLGQHPSRRRGRHRLLAACRHGDRVRRHARGRPPARARADQRSGLGRDAPCRRRLPGSDRLRAASTASTCRCSRPIRPARARCERCSRLPCCWPCWRQRRRRVLGVAGDRRGRDQPSRPVALGARRRRDLRARRRADGAGVLQQPARL